MDRKIIMLAMQPTRFRDDLTFLLGHENFEVIHASNGDQVLKKVKQYPVKGIVSQLNLPMLDGLELILNIQDLQFSIPIIVISFNKSDLEEKVLEAGATTFFQYPIEPNKVIRKLVEKFRG
jgi:DNA-binding response OmpR family regulator